MARRSRSSNSGIDVLCEETDRLGVKVTEAREAANLHVRDFGSCGLWAKTLSPVENGKAMITEASRLSVFEKIRTFLDLEPAYFEPELSCAIAACSRLAKTEPTAAGRTLFDVPLVECYYRIGPDRLPIEWRQTWVLRPRSPTRTMRRYYLYSGDDNADVHQVVRGGHRLGDVNISPTTRFRYYDVEFTRNVSPGETHVLEEEVLFPNAASIPDPFCTGGIEHPVATCECLLVRLEFDPSSTPSQMYVGSGPIYHIGTFDEEEVVKVRDNQNYFEKEFETPQCQRHFGFRWLWA